MTRKAAPVVHCPGPVSRRSFLQIGSLALAGLTLPDLLQMRSQARAAGKPINNDKAVLLVWLPGGPPHHETFDMKPEASSEIRGDFLPIKTNVPGIEICEHLPLHAKIADKFTIIRSVHHEFADHGGGHKRFLTGRLPKEPTGFVNDAPAVTSCVAKCREKMQADLPNVVALTDPGRQGVDVFSLGAAYLGPSYTPFMVGADPSRPDFRLENLELDPKMAARVEDRLTLLRGMDNLRRSADTTGALDAMDKYNRRAFELLTNPRMRDAFDLSKEPAALRERYGHHAYGQRALLGRRLIEAGSSFVTLTMENPVPGKAMPKYATYNWDSHAVNCHLFDDAKFRLPLFDQAVTALIEDVYARGLDKDLMVIVTGEFGRTPRINSQTGTQTGVSQPGRDHWPNAMSMQVFGGGIRTGQVIGSTDSMGAYPKDRPLTPNDLWATVYQHLGIDYTQSFIDHTGRPMPILPFGEPIRELFA